MRVFLSLAFGLLVGSFLNVVIIRLPLGRSIVRPGSHCGGCERPIRWRDNLPILSFLLLRGRCRFCRQPISIRYPVVEALTALLFLADVVRFGERPLWVFFVRDWPFLALLVCITFIDLEHRIIPDVLSLGGLILGCATYWLIPGFSFYESFGGALFGFTFFYSLAWIYQKLRGRMGLGGGDIKLLSMLGAFLGPYGVLVTLCVSSIFGTIVGLLWAKFLDKKELMQFAIPFGPFLVVGALLYYFLGDVLWYLFMKPI